MRVLVSGGNGFIGRYVCEELVHHGHEPLVFDRHHDNPAFNFILGDIRDATAVTDAIAHTDAVVHLAGVLGTQETIQNPRPAVDVNVNGGLNVLEACTQYKVPLVNIAVGNYFENNTYAISKNTVERLVEMYVKDRGLTACSVRALNAYGPRQSCAAPYGPSKVRKITPWFVQSALHGKPIEVYGDGLQIMDMVHVRDVARVLVAAIGHVGLFEAGTGRETTVLDVANAVLNEVGRGSIEHLPMRPGETPGVVVLGDPKTLRPLGIIPSDLTTLEDGIKETVYWYAHAHR